MKPHITDNTLVKLILVLTCVKKRFWAKYSDVKTSPYYRKWPKKNISIIELVKKVESVATEKQEFRDFFSKN